MRTKHYNTSELATVLGCSTGYVYQLLKEGRIKGHKHRTGKWLVPKDQEEVFALIRKELTEHQERVAANSAPGESFVSYIADTEHYEDIFDRMSLYTCISTASDNLILDVGERQLSITQEEEFRLLSLLNKTPQSKQREVLIANFNARIAGRPDEKSYYSRRFADEFLKLHGIEPTPTIRKSKKEYIKQSSPLKSLAFFIGLLAGGSILFLLADKIFDWLPSLNADVFVELLVVVLGCACFLGGVGLFGISIYLLSNRR